MTSTMRFNRWENSLGQPYGTVLQVVQAVKTDTASTTSTTFGDIAGLSAVITPKFSNSKILVQVAMSVNANQDATTAMFKLLRDSTEIGLGDTAGSRIRTALPRVGSTNANSVSVVSNFLDTPAATSPIIYKIQWKSEISGNPIWVNRSNFDADNTSTARSISTITLMEIAQ
jgi:hypothetical protein